MPTATALAARSLHLVGQTVEVVNRFDGSWCAGFTIAAVVAGGFRVRRLSDGVVLPVVFPIGTVRPLVAAEPGWTPPGRR